MTSRFRPGAAGLSTMALAFWLAAGGIALAELPEPLQGQIETAVRQPTANQVAQAVRPLFEGNLTQVVEIAVEGARIEPGTCAILMREGSAASPERAVDIAAGIISVTPVCEEQVAGVLSEILESAAGPENLTPAAGGPGFPSPNPITAISTTAENPSTDAASPTLP